MAILFACYVGLLGPKKLNKFSMIPHLQCGEMFRSLHKHFCCYDKNILIKSNLGGKGLFILQFQTIIHHSRHIKTGIKLVTSHSQSRAKENGWMLTFAYPNVSTHIVLDSSALGGPTLSCVFPHQLINWNNAPLKCPLGQLNGDNLSLGLPSQVILGFVKLKIKVRH